MTSLYPYMLDLRTQKVAESMMAVLAERLRVESAIRGYHVYKEVWDAAIGEELLYRREAGNPYDWYAVSVVRGTEYHCWPCTSKDICGVFMHCFFVKEEPFNVR